MRKISKKNLSVIITTYNSENTIKETLISILNKNLFFIDEILIVDDGSVDNTISIIKMFQKKNFKIKLLINKINRGGGYTRNKGIKNAKNFWIYILDSDDLVDDKSLIKLFEAAIKYNQCVHYEKAKYFTIKKKIKFIFNYGKFYKKEITLKKLMDNLGVFLVNGIINKRIWKKIGGYPEFHHWDTQCFSFRCLLRSNIRIIKNTFYFHRAFSPQNKSYYERQESLGNNHVNSLLVYEEIFCSKKINLNWKKNFYKKLQNKNIFLNKNIDEIIKEKKEIKDKNFLNRSLGYYNLFFKIISNKINSQKKSKKLIELININNEFLNDITMFYLIKLNKLKKKENFDPFKIRKDILNIFYMLRLIFSTNIKLYFAKFYIKYYFKSLFILIKKKLI